MQQHERRWEESGGPYRSGSMEPWRTSESERSWRGTQNGGERTWRSRGQYRGEGWDDEDFGRGGYPERGWFSGSSRSREEEDFGDYRGEYRPYRSSNPYYGREEERERFSSGREGYRREDFGREGYGQGYGREGFAREGYGREGFGMTRGGGREGYGYGRETQGRYGYGGPSYSRDWERFREGERSFGPSYGQGSFGGSSYGQGYRPESQGRSGGQGFGGQEWNRSGSEWAGGGFGSGREGWGMGREFGTSRGYGSFTGRAPKNYKRSDERIREDVCDVLTECDLDCEEVEVTVRDGEVTLTGTVQSREDRREMERTAERVMGVKDVTNQIRVKRDTGKGERSDETRKQSTTTQGYSDSRRGQGTMTSTRPE